MPPVLHKPLWFVGLWLGGVATLTVVALIIRSIIFRQPIQPKEDVDKKTLTVSAPRLSGRMTRTIQFLLVQA